MATTMNPARWQLLERALAAPEPRPAHDRDDERDRPRPLRRPGLAANHRSLRDALRRR